MWPWSLEVRARSNTEIHSGMAVGQSEEAERPTALSSRVWVLNEWMIVDRIISTRPHPHFILKRKLFQEASGEEKPARVPTLFIVTH